MSVDKSRQPEPGRLIRCKGFDWSPFECVGKFVPYKAGSPKRLRGKSRFMMRNELGLWVAARDTWKDVETWEYLSPITDSPKQPPHKDAKED